MKMDWKKYVGRTLNITMIENYGVVYGTPEKSEHPAFYEIVFKTGLLSDVFDEGLLLESKREELVYNIFVPFGVIKCVEIY
ncbi:MAG: hypothetical protein FD143_1354 [Ignavibacteria bacterium]|nr:MAG: hypothetical protein FD143_1354 [Ignavibacteria bacterium]KAF0160660.1 MAG: hypothetical protein FD188_1567 [Ignavibacteria bacterium]